MVCMDMCVDVQLKIPLTEELGIKIIAPIRISNVVQVAQNNAEQGKYVTKCNTLQHTATHCNLLQQPATYCNTVNRGDL